MKNPRRELPPGQEALGGILTGIAEEAMRSLESLQAGIDRYESRLRRFSAGIAVTASAEEWEALTEEMALESSRLLDLNRRLLAELAASRAGADQIFWFWKSACQIRAISPRVI